MFAAVSGEVTVVAVDHRQARAHEPGEVEDRDPGAEREGGVGVTQIVGPADRLNAGGELCGPPLARAEVVQVDVTAARCRKQQRALELGQLVFLFQHVTFSINSICHFFGEQPLRTRDESRNVWLLAIPSFGESWHNGHHAFPASAVHGLEPGQLDISAIVIRGMERLGLASALKRPEPQQISRRRVVAE